MSSLKSYNVQALRGNQYDDKEFQSDMKESGINIPDNLLYRKEIGPFVINEIHKQNIAGLPKTKNPATGMNYTQEEAVEFADKNRSDALKLYNSML